MKRMLMASALMALVVAATPAFASIGSAADALVPAAQQLVDPYSRGLALGWLEIAARQDREVLISHTYNDAALRALQNARHYIDGSVPFAPIHGTKQWPSEDHPDWIAALREIERVGGRAAHSPCKGESAGRLEALTDEVWKEQDETHGSHWVHGWAQTGRTRKLAQQVDHELDACPPAVLAPEPIALPSDTLFAFDSPDITDEGRLAIAQLAGRVTGLVIRRMTVTGYTDRLGPNAYNLALSRRRAEAVAQALSAARVQSGRVDTRGLGKADPVVDCPGTESDAVIACLAPNRRVTVQVESEAALPSEMVSPGLTSGQMHQVQQLLHPSYATPWD